MPQSAEQTIPFNDVNAAGAAPPNGSNVAYTRVRSQHDDGSFVFQQISVRGTTEVLTQNPDGSGRNTVSNATGTTSSTLSVPLYANGGYSIPVCRVNTATGSNKTYAAADWYPNGGLPSTPLVLQAQTVVGPVAIQLAECSGALVQLNMAEVGLLDGQPQHHQRFDEPNQYSVLQFKWRLCLHTDSANYPELQSVDRCLGLYG